MHSLGVNGGRSGLSECNRKGINEGGEGNMGFIGAFNGTWPVH